MNSKKKDRWTEYEAPKPETSRHGMVTMRSSGTLSFGHEVMDTFGAGPVGVKFDMETKEVLLTKLDPKGPGAALFEISLPEAKEGQDPGKRVGTMGFRPVLDQMGLVVPDKMYRMVPEIDGGEMLLLFDWPQESAEEQAFNAIAEKLQWVSDHFPDNVFTMAIDGHLMLFRDTDHDGELDTLEDGVTPDLASVGKIFPGLHVVDVLEIEERLNAAADTITGNGEGVALPPIDDEHLDGLQEPGADDE
jgi:hypothetical protein